MLFLELGFPGSLSRVESSAIAVDVGTQILAALIVGLITAFAFQLLLTSLGLAIGITALGFRTAASTKEKDLKGNDLQKSSTAQLGSALSKVSLAAGLSILVTIDTVLFAASFLAVKVTRVSDPVSGGLVGLIIWSAYFLILIWISSIAISSITGSILDLATAGVRRLVGAIGSAFTPTQDRPQTDSLLTEGAAIALIRQETALSLTNVRPIVEDYLKTIAPPQPDLATLRHDLLVLMQDLELPAGWLHSSDRRRLMQLIQQRTGFSESDADQLVGQLESHWQETHESEAQTSLSLPQELVSQLRSFLQSANPEEVEPEQIGTQLEQSLSESPNRVSQLSQLLNLPQIDFKQVLRQGLSQIDVSELIDASDLQISDLQIETVWQQLQSLQQRFQAKATAAESKQAESDSVDFDPAIDVALSEKVIHLRQKLESYLRYTNPEKLTPDRVELKLKQILEETKVALPKFDAADWTALLDRRKSLNQPQRQQIVAKLAEVWESSQSWQSDRSNRASNPSSQKAKPLQLSQPKTLQISDSSPDSSSEPAALSQLQPALDSFFSKVGDYFDSFNPPSFDDQKIQQVLDRLLENPKFSLPDLDLSDLNQWVQSVLPKGSPLSAAKKILEAPQAAIQMLPDRLDQWSHELFTQLLTELSEGLPQSRQALSEALPQPFLIQAATLRDRLLQQMEQLQQEAQQQVEQVKQQVQQQVEETRKVAAVAAWWLFFTACSAACSAAIAGVLGVEFLKIK